MQNDIGRGADEYLCYLKMAAIFQNGCQYIILEIIRQISFP